MRGIDQVVMSLRVDGLILVLDLFLRSMSAGFDMFLERILSFSKGENIAVKVIVIPGHCHVGHCKDYK